MERGLSKNEIVNTLSKSAHGKLEEYVPLVSQAAKAEPEFLAHLIAWNHINGQIRDSKIALPLISLSEPGLDVEFVENSLAHLASLDPRMLVQANKFSKAAKIGRRRQFEKVIKRYLDNLESNWAKWTRAAVQHRDSLRYLYQFPYTTSKIKLTTRVKDILFERNYPKGTIFYKLTQLKNMPALEAAGVIIEERIPFLIVQAALGDKIKDPDIALALINRMSATEFVSHQKMLEKLGVKTVPALRAAYEEAVQRAAASKKTTLKATKAAENIGDEVLKAKIQNLQEKQIKAVSVEGNWLVLGDKSGSMASAIEFARHLAATLAKMAKGEVHLVFFDTAPRYINASGKTYEELLNETKHVSANGGTSIGCGLRYALDKKLDIDGIAIVTDGGENTAPMFAETYTKYCERFDKEPPVYLYLTEGDSNAFAGNMQKASHELQIFDLSRGKTDYYALPNLVQTMRISRYGLIEQIMETPLLTLDGVLGPVREKVAV